MNLDVTDRNKVALMRHPAPLLAVVLSALAMGACAPRWKLPATPPARQEPVPVSPELASAVASSRASLRPRLATMPGLSVAVADREGLLWSEGFGVADLADGRPVTPRTRFRIYSVAKPITATLAVRLHRRGHLDLRAPVAEYLPDLPPELGRVTLAELMSHTAGVRDYARGEWARVSSVHCETAAEALAPFVADPLVAEPGREFAYTSFGFVLASAVLEAAGGAPFLELLEREILHPAGMTDTSLDLRPYDGDLVSAFYEPSFLGRVRQAPAWDNSCKWGAGGLLSTAEDLVRFGRAVLDGTLVDAAGRDLLFTPAPPASAEQTGYGLGWGLHWDSDGSLRRVAHSGGSPGGRSYLLLDLEGELAVALTANLEGERLNREADAVADAFRAARGPETPPQGDTGVP